MNKKKEKNHSSKQSWKKNALYKKLKNLSEKLGREIFIGITVAIIIGILATLFKSIKNIIVNSHLSISDFLHSFVGTLIFYMLFLYFVVSILLITKRGLRGCLLYDRKKCICRLGIIGLKKRDDEKIETVLQKAKNSYNWMGLSAVNELARPISQDLIGQAAKKQTKFSYTLLSPSDVLRITDQAKWEKGNEVSHVNNIKSPEVPRALTEPKDIVDNIEKSVKILKKLDNNGNVSVLLANRLPWLRVTQIDDSFFHVAHYDRGGCGFYGDILEIGYEEDAKLSKKDDSEPLLVTWLKHFILTEHKNSLIDDIYAEISRYYCRGYRGEELIDIILNGDEFKGIRSNFHEVFKWHLDEETIQESIKYVIKRYGLHAQRCPCYIEKESACALGVESIKPKGEATFEEIKETEKSITYFGATGYWPLESIHSQKFIKEVKKNPEKYTIHFIPNHADGPALMAAELIFNRKGDERIIIEDHSERLEKFFDGLGLIEKNKKRERSRLIYHNFIPAFRILEKDEETMYISFYQEGKSISETPVLILKKSGSHDENEIILYEWFYKFLQRMEYTTAIWDIEREVLHRWINSKTTPGNADQLLSIRVFADKLFQKRGLEVNAMAVKEITKKIVHWVLKYQQSRENQ